MAGPDIITEVEGEESEYSHHPIVKRRLLAMLRAGNEQLKKVTADKLAYHQAHVFTLELVLALPEKVRAEEARKNRGPVEPEPVAPRANLGSLAEFAAQVERDFEDDV